MKKITHVCGLALLGLVGFATPSFAQITITSSDLPTVGSFVYTATDSTSAFTPGAMGASQSWNFSTAKKQLVDKIMFMDPSSTPYATIFKNANLADSTVGTTGSGSKLNGYNFFNLSSTVFEVEGSEEIVPYTYATLNFIFQIEINLSPEFVQANLPGNYGEEFNGVSRGRDDFAKDILGFYDSVRVITNIAYFDTVDAWGTLTLPTGTFNVLRKNHHEVDIDSIAEHSATSGWGSYSTQTTSYHQYQWFTNDAGYILAEMNTNPTTGAFVNLIWDTTALPTGINELSFSSKISTFPNPCSNQITFMLTSNNTQAKIITVYDVAGRQLDKVEMKNNNTVLNTSAYASGMYLYTITDTNGNIVDHGKFMVK